MSSPHFLKSLPGLSSVKHWSVGLGEGTLQVQGQLHLSCIEMEKSLRWVSDKQEHELFWCLRDRKPKKEDKTPPGTD